MKHLLLLALACLCALPALAQGSNNMSLLYHQTYPEDMSDIWGFVWSGTEYAVVTTKTRVEIFDLTDPSNPNSVLNLPDLISSTWRDAKFWDGYVYVINETGGGMQIIDVRNLPGPISEADVSYVFPDGMTDAHNIFIDENGVGYICGANTGDTKIIDIAANPADPPVIGTYDVAYVHDLFVRGDTMWTAEIYQGRFGVVDISDKANPVLMATKITPDTFTHNTWLNDAGDVLFTTDEVSGAFVAAYDVSDLTDINMLDGYQSSPGMNVMPHNTHVIGDFLVTSYYKDGVTVCDISRPGTIVQVANYDTNPVSGPGYIGCWGVYPYLPSGIILATDDYEGFFVLDVEYNPAAFIEGTITDAATGLPIFNAIVEINGDGIGRSDLLGYYEGGQAESGLVDVTVTAPGFPPVTITGVQLIAGETTLLDIPLGTATIDLDVKLLLEGPYIGSGMMNLGLNTLGLIPTKPPFQFSPWEYVGPEEATTIPANVVDWIMLELREAASPYTVLQQRVAWLTEDGLVKDLDGISNLQFTDMPIGDYKVAVRHWSHMDVLSADDLSVPSPAYEIDFTTDVQAALGSDPMVQLADGNWALYAGDHNGDGVFTFEDYNVHIFTASRIYEYFTTDLNFDGVVSVADFNLYKKNFNKMTLQELTY